MTRRRHTPEQIIHATANHENRAGALFNVAKGHVAIPVSGADGFTNEGTVRLGSVTPPDIASMELTGSNYRQNFSGMTAVCEGAELVVSGGDVFIDGGLMFLDAPATMENLHIGAGARMRPGCSAGHGHVFGNAIREPGAALDIEIGDAALGIWDTLSVHGGVALAGTLKVVPMEPSTVAIGDTLEVMRFESRQGTFDEFRLLDGDPTGLMHPVYTDTSLSIVIDAELVAVDPLEVPSTRVRFRGWSVPGGGSGFELALPFDGQVKLEVYDVAGRLVARLADQFERAGLHRYDLRGRAGERCPSGIYFGRVEIVSQGKRQTHTARTVVVR
jgi:hypothetical protein